MSEMAEYFLRQAEEDHLESEYTFMPKGIVKIERASEEAYLITVQVAPFNTFWVPRALCRVTPWGRINYILTMFLDSKLNVDDFK